MEMEEFRASRYADGLRRHRAFIVAITVCGILAGALVSRSSTGQSMTVLLSIEQQSALALTGDNNQRASTPIFSVRDEVNALTQRLTKLNITAEATMDPDQSGAKVTISGMSKTTLENDVARAQNEWNRIHKDSVTLWANAVSASLRTRVRALEDSLKAADADTSRPQEASVLAASIAELSGRTAALDEYAETAERRANFISGRSKMMASEPWEVDSSVDSFFVASAHCSRSCGPGWTGVFEVCAKSRRQVSREVASCHIRRLSKPTSCFLHSQVLQRSTTSRFFPWMGAQVVRQLSPRSLSRAHQR